MVRFPVVEPPGSHLELGAVEIESIDLQICLWLHDITPDWSDNN